MIVYVVKWEFALAFLVWGEVKMELRRPTLADKETILNMMTEFDIAGFWALESDRYQLYDWKTPQQGPSGCQWKCQ